VLRRGSLVPYSHPNVLAFERVLDGERVLVLLNTRASTVTYNVPTALRGTDWTNLLDSSNLSLENSLVLPPHSVRILAN
jgi:hypothetical protein